VTFGLRTRLIAEFVGTALLVGIGTAAVVATTGVGGGRFVILAVAWFAAVTIPVFAFAFVSGSEINPVVTLALVLDGRRPPREAILYGLAQFAGAFLGSALVGLAFGSFEHLGATTPADGNVVRTFLLEFAFTFALIVTVLALVRAGAGRGRWRLTWPGAVVALSTFLIGPWTGSSLNPARSIAPAILSSTYPDLWVYLVATPLAAVVATVAARAAERFRAEL
jgi:glycerol uptake facilitator-like aquaporin